MTAMRKALAGAGFDGTADRLRKLAEEALASSNGNFERAVKKMKEGVLVGTELLAEVSGAALIDGIADRHCRRYLRALANTRKNDGGEGATHGVPAGQFSHAPPAVATQSGSEEPQHASPVGHAPTVSSVPASGDHGIAANQPSRVPARPRSLEAISSLGATAAKSMLDIIRVGGGKRIRDATVEEANTWASGQEREARWIRMLTANLLPTAIIGVHRSDDYADACWKRVQEVSDE